MTRAAAIEVTLGWRDGRWIASGPGVDVEHADLATLDSLIVASMASQGLRNPHAEPRPSKSGGAPLRIHVRFDVGALPTWLRQYQAHYFNYVLSVDRADAA